MCEQTIHSLAGRLPRRRFLQTAAAGAILLGAPGTIRAVDPRPRPNIVFITTDQQHWRAYGAVDPFFDTPHIDGLARGGTVFTHAFCTTPQCSASRSSIYTGLYPHKTRVIGNIESVRHDGAPVPPLAEGTDTLGAKLRRAGYHTAYFGKWHLGNRDHFKT
ncbi:MAG TPA: sulfatase-like hydrolase/transferase, partial [Candidatus Hydrogenedentes bacterium]|nr:sulfatase-like hydrolase/transferase [Candidatus Hydrogenedentota bacterium]